MIGTPLVRGALLGAVRLLTGAHAVWTGVAPSAAPRIYYANHSSHLDTLVIVAALPAPVRARAHPVAALDYWGRTRLHRFVAVACLRGVLLDRHPVSGDPLAPLAAVLARGESLVIFPEGTRGDGTPGAFRAGIHHLARRFPDVQLVPVHLENLHRVLPKGRILPVPLICTLRFGAPLTLRPGEARDAFLARARDALLRAGQPA